MRQSSTVVQSVDLQSKRLDFKILIEILDTINQKLDCIPMIVLILQCCWEE